MKKKTQTNQKNNENEFVSDEKFSNEIESIRKNIIENENNNTTEKKPGVDTINKNSTKINQSKGSNINDPKLNPPDKKDTENVTPQKKGVKTQPLQENKKNQDNIKKPITSNISRVSVDTSRVNNDKKVQGKQGTITSTKNKNVSEKDQQKSKESIKINIKKSDANNDYQENVVSVNKLQSINYKTNFIF